MFANHEINPRSVKPKTNHQIQRKKKKRNNPKTNVSYIKLATVVMLVRSQIGITFVWFVQKFSKQNENNKINNKQHNRKKSVICNSMKIA